jgi:ketosteroid isomerase-like protein
MTGRGDGCEIPATERRRKIETMRKMQWMVIMMLTGHVSFAQRNTTVDSIVAAEKAFAATSKQRNTREAFLTFLADSGLIFQDGPVNGKSFWEKASPNESLLSWYPAYAFASSSANIGYSTGPWEYRIQPSDSAAAGHGYFVSIWKKEEKGWRVALDIGISFPSPLAKEANHFENSTYRSKAVNGPGTRNDLLLKRENDFIASLSKEGYAAYKKSMLDDSRLYRPGSAPFFTAAGRDRLFSEKDKKYSFEPLAEEVSETGDMGYVYGKVLIQITKDGSAHDIHGNYLRIWKRKGPEWKIALDLVNVAR